MRRSGPADDVQALIASVTVLRTVTLVGDLTGVAVDERRRHVFVTNAGTTDRSGTWATLGNLHVLDAQSGALPYPTMKHIVARVAWTGLDAFDTLHNSSLRDRRRLARRLLTVTPPMAATTPVRIRTWIDMTLLLVV